MPIEIHKELLKFAGNAHELYDKYKRNGTTISVPENPLLFVPQQVFRTIKRHYKKAGIELSNIDGVVDFHALRVTYINLVIRSGVDAKGAQTLARHSNVDLTFNTYGRANFGQMMTTIEQVGNIIFAERK